MKVGMLMDVMGGTQAQYDAAMLTIGLTSGSETQPWPKGLITHTAGPIDGGWRVVDVWESKEDAKKFFDERLGAAIHASGMPEAQPQFFPVYNVHTA